MKILLLCLLFGLTSGINPQVAQAEGISLSTFPTTLQLRAQPGADLRAGFSIENKANKPVKLNISIKPFKADAVTDGKVAYLEGNNPQLLQKKVQIVDNGFATSSIELGPKQSKNLNLRIELDPREPISEYYFSIIFISTDDKDQAEQTQDVAAVSHAQAGIALHVLLAIGPRELPQGQIEEFSTPLYRNSGPVPFTVKVQNKGPHFMTPKGVILIKNIFGQTVGRIDLHNTNILAGTSRSLLGIPYQLNAKNSPANPEASINTDYGEPSKTVWSEQFLLGLYTADLSLALSEDGPVFNQTIRFIAFPWQALLWLGIAGILALLIAIRVRKTLKRS